MRVNNQERLNRLPDAFLFDTDNTLYPYDPAHAAAQKAVRDKVVKTFSISPDDFDKAFKEARTQVKTRLKNTASSHSRLLYLQRMLEIMGLGSQVLLALDFEQTYWRTFLSNCRLFPDVLGFIHLIKSKGIITANITDLTAQIQFRKLVYFGLDELFDYVVTSEEAGADKPDKRPFEVALEKLQIEPKNIWMIGDNPKSDMEGAGEMGMVKIQKKHYGVEVINFGIAKPDLVFNDYKELISVIS